MAKYVEETKRFLKEVRVEMSKVTWPTWLELRGSTILVIIVSIFFAAYIGIFDIIITIIIGFFTGGKIR
ncbi:MAG: preprotein translocase subunit SecE [Candidatus Latescibacter sp.]|nr:preprotein translocase subunit SecE [Candidatus Latescibacter sp.]